MTTTTNLIAVWGDGSFCGVVHAGTDLAELANEAGVTITKTVACSMCYRRDELPAGAIVIGTSDDCGVDTMDDGLGHRGNFAYTVA